MIAERVEVEIMVGDVDHIVELACVRAPVRRDAVGPDGLVNDAAVRAAIRAAMQALAAHVVERGRVPR
jgi:hypothetical protein